MPEICRFFGIVIRMYFDDHVPPHFHARYGSHTAAVGIGSISLLKGGLPPRAQSMVFEWAALHQAELLENWEAIRSGGTARPIEPLN